MFKQGTGPQLRQALALSSRRTWGREQLVWQSRTYSGARQAAWSVSTPEQPTRPLEHLPVNTVLHPRHPSGAWNDGSSPRSRWLQRSHQGACEAHRLPLEMPHQALSPALEATRRTHEGYTGVENATHSRWQARGCGGWDSQRLFSGLHTSCPAGNALREPQRHSSRHCWMAAPPGPEAGSHRIAPSATSDVLNGSGHCGPGGKKEGQLWASARCRGLGTRPLPSSPCPLLGGARPRSALTDPPARVALRSSSPAQTQRASSHLRSNHQPVLPTSRPVCPHSLLPPTHTCPCFSAWHSTPGPETRQPSWTVPCPARESVKAVAAPFSTSLRLHCTPFIFSLDC